VAIALTALALVPARAAAEPPGPVPVVDPIPAAIEGERLPGAPLAPVELELSQPDGSSFAAVPWGDRSLHGFETPDGFTVVQAPSGEWRYADGRQGDGELRPGPTAPDEAVPPARTPAHQRPAASTASIVDDQVIDVPMSGSEHGAFVPNTGSQPTLVVLAEFTDQGPVGSSGADWASRFFGERPSVRDYYDEASYGHLDLVPAAESSGTPGDGVVGWVNLGYDHPDSGTDDEMGWEADLRLARDAIVAADPFVDYAAFDADGDGVLAPGELHVVVVVAGYETAYSGPAPDAVCGSSVWAHNWELYEYTPTVDGVSVGGEGGSYSMFGEFHCEKVYDDPGEPASIGVIVHELGHDLGWPDLYDVDYSSAGVGSWSVMGTGAWTGAAPDDRPGSSPVHPDAWSKSAQGWVEPNLISGPAAGVAFGQAATAPDVAQLLPNPGGVDWRFGSQGSGIYFLVENRQPVGYDEGLPGCGLLVWHIDEHRSGNNFANSVDARRLVDLEEADGFAHLDKRINLGDPGDPYPGSKPNFLFGPDTNPNSNTFGLARSGVEVRPGSTSCAPTMVADIISPVVPEICAPDDEFEPNNTRETARAIEGNVPVKGILCPGDFDYFFVETTRSGPVEARLDFVHANGDLDMVIHDLRTGRVALGESRIGPEWVQFSDALPGTYVVGVWGRGAAQNAYELRVETPDPGVVPGQPTHLVGTRRNGAVDVSWAAPVSVGSSPISHYRVTASPGGRTCDDVASPCTVTGLTNGIAYTFTAVAFGEAGPSVASEPSAPVTPATRPGKPTGVVAAGRNQAVQVSWAAPASDGGYPVQQYRVIDPTGLHGCETAGGLSCAVTGLTNGTQYTFTVRAVNAVGTGARSDASGPAIPRTVPSSPRKVTVTARNQAVLVAWNPPADAGGAPITGYRVRTGAGSAACRTRGATSCVARDLVNGRSYTFRVRGLNVAGAGRWSASSSSVVPRTVPDAPRKVRAVVPRSRAIRVDWDRPASDGGAPIQRYVAKASPGGRTCTTSARTCTIDGSKKGQSYAVRVRAINVAGGGAWSRAVRP
jgi:M6 family metalloprotease-like protein